MYVRRLLISTIPAIATAYPPNTEARRVLHKTRSLVGFEVSGRVTIEDFGLGQGAAVPTLRAGFLTCEVTPAETPVWRLAPGQ